MFSQPNGILHDSLGLLLPYEIILGVVLNKKEYYITCEGHAKILFFWGGVGETAHVVLALVPVRHFCNDCGPILLKLSMMNFYPDFVEPF